MPSANSQSTISQKPWPPAGVEWYYSDDHVAIAHGDCRELLPHVEADVLVTDPPYGVSKPGGDFVGRPGKGTRRQDFLPGDHDREAMTSLALVAISGAINAGCSSAYVFCGWMQQMALRDLFEGDFGWRTRPIIWSKKCPPPALPGTGWPRGHEMAIAAFGPGWTWAHAVGEGPRSDVLTADSYRHGQPGKVDHPTQKPLSVISTICATTNGTILDPFMGSGTTLRAAKDLGRKAIGIEIEERYCEIAAKRLAQEVLAL